MNTVRVLLLTFVPFLPAACQSAPASNPVAAAGTAEAAKVDDKKDDAKAKAEAKKQKQKDLRGKQRELDAAKVEQQIAEMDRMVRQLSVDAAMAKTAAELARAQADLESFLKDVKPREMAEKKLELDQGTYRAEHSKDELGELTAMYEADEFARTTKELVLKRGRRELEVSERHLAIAKQESAYFEGVTMPQRERELRQKLADAELERKKAGIDAEKAKVEVALATKKAQEKLADLQEDIADLVVALAKETP